MTIKRDTDTLLRSWMTDVARGTVAEERLAMVTAEIGHRRPRPTLVARLHDRSTHGFGAGQRARRDVGLFVLVGALMLMLVAVASQLAAGGSPVPNGVGPAAPVSSPEVPPPTPGASSDGTASAPSPQPAVATLDVGPLCPADAAATLPTGPLPVTSRPSTASTTNGPLAIDGPEVLDSTTGSSRGSIALTSGGARVDLGTTLTHWSADGRWLSVRYAYASDGCSQEFIVSSDLRRAIDVTGYPVGRTVLDAVWSPDGRWLAIDAWDRVDVFGIDPDGRIHDARTVWQGSRGDVAFGPAWGPEGTLAFTIQGGSSARVGFVSPGASKARILNTQTGHLAPLAWTADGTAVIAIADAVPDVGMFRITPDGSTRIPLPGLHLHGGKWLDVPVAIVGDRIVFTAFTDPAQPDVEDVYSVAADGSGLTRLSDTAQSVTTGWTFAAAPDGRLVAASGPHEIWIIDPIRGEWRRLTDRGGGILDWGPVPAS